MTTGTGIDYKTVKVGSVEFKLIPLAPNEAIDFCTDAMVSLSPVLTSVEIGEGGIGALIMQVIPNIGRIDPAKLKAMFAVVRRQMQLPNGKFAQNEAAYHDYFRENPSHLMESHVKGLFALVRDFFPQELGTILGAQSLKNS
jgi:hypothetical protein